MAYDFPMANSGDGALPRAVILAIDDEPTVLRAVQRDLRSRFGERFRARTQSTDAMRPSSIQIGRRNFWWTR